MDEIAIMAPFALLFGISFALLCKSVREDRRTRTGGPGCRG